jgi:hypothetical protein
MTHLVLGADIALAINGVGLVRMGCRLRACSRIPTIGS